MAGGDDWRFMTAFGPWGLPVDDSPTHPMDEDPGDRAQAIQDHSMYRSDVHEWLSGPQPQDDTFQGPDRGLNHQHTTASDARHGMPVRVDLRPGRQTVREYIDHMRDELVVQVTGAMTLAISNHLASTFWLAPLGYPHISPDGRVSDTTLGQLMLNELRMGALLYTPGSMDAVQHRHQKLQQAVADLVTKFERDIGQGDPDRRQTTELLQALRALAASTKEDT